MFVMNKNLVCHWPLLKKMRLLLICLALMSKVNGDDTIEVDPSAKAYASYSDNKWTVSWKLNITFQMKNVCTLHRSIF